MEQIPEQNITQQDLTGTEQNKNWLQQEIEQNKPEDFDKLPGLIFEKDDITEFEILEEDVKEPFKRWDGEGVTKRIVPVVHNKEKKNWWINIKNPILYELYERIVAGERKFRVLCTGEKQYTRYKFK